MVRTTDPSGAGAVRRLLARFRRRAARRPHGRRPHGGRWRGVAGVAQSAQVGALLAGTLVISTSLVAHGPPVGDQVGTLWTCELLQRGGPCLTPGPDHPGLPGLPTRIAAPAAPAHTPLINPASVQAGGSYTPPGGAPVQFRWCWQTSDQNFSKWFFIIWEVTRTLCSDTAGQAWECVETRHPNGQFPPIVTRSCAPTTDTEHPDLVTCLTRPDGTRSCQVQALDSQSSDGTRFFEDPSVPSGALQWTVNGVPLGSYADVQAYCAANLGACNAQLTSDLSSLVGALDKVHDRFAGCDGTLAPAYAHNPVEYHTVTGPDGTLGVELKVGNGWTNLADLQGLIRSNPARVGAIVYALQRSLLGYFNLTGSMQRPAQEVAGIEAMLHGMTVPVFVLALRDLGDANSPFTLAGASCDAMAAEFGLAAATAHREGDVAGYTDLCALPGPDGSCARWVSTPQEVVTEADPSTQIDIPGVSIALSAEERRTGRVAGLVPGVPDASYEEALAYCQQHADECAATARAGLAATQRSALDLLEGIGLCSTDTECTAVSQQIAGDAQAHSECGAGQLGAPINPKLIAAVVGIGTVCGFGGGVGAFSLANASPYLAALIGAIGGAVGSALGFLISAYLTPDPPPTLAPREALTLAMFDGMLQNNLALWQQDVMNLQVGMAELRAAAAAQGYALPAWLATVLVRMGLANRPRVE